MRFYWVFLRFLILILTVPYTLHSEPVTEQRFKELLMYHVSNIPELKPLWSATRSTVAADEVYLSGGILRGLIHYLHGEISRNGVAGARQARTPHIDELFLQEWSDSDLVSPRVTIQRIS